METELLADLIVMAKTIVVFTGAGVSTESGIPDFRSPGGIWSKYDPDEFTIQRFLTSPDARRKQWKMLTDGSLTTEAKPNDAHYAIAELNSLGKLDCVISQNVDNLHQEAGVPDDKVLELHGNMRWAVCLTCHRRLPMREVLQMIQEGTAIPDCPHCHGILKPDAVFFGEGLPQETLMEATRRSQSCDLFIVIGSSLVVYPAAYMPMYARDAKAKLAIVNLSPTPLDRYATVVIRRKAGEAMSEVMKNLRAKISPSG